MFAQKFTLSNKITTELEKAKYRQLPKNYWFYVKEANSIFLNNER